MSPDSFIPTCIATLELDLRYRAEKLSHMKLLPRLYGHEIKHVFSQKYTGNVTMFPRLTWAQSFGLKAIMNPSVADTKQYIQEGQLSCWNQLVVIKHLLKIEARYCTLYLYCACICSCCIQFVGILFHVLLYNVCCCVYSVWDCVELLKPAVSPSQLLNMMDTGLGDTADSTQRPLILSTNCMSADNSDLLEVRDYVEALESQIRSLKSRLAADQQM